MITPKMLQMIEAQRIAKGMTRAEMAEKMETESGEEWDTEQLNKTLTGRSVPRAETLFLMMKVLGMPCWPWEWCRSKQKEPA